MIKIKDDEFKQRILTLQSKMVEMSLDAILVYGDEYRKENLRYVSNFWPIFERGALFIPRKGEPIYAGAPEGENYAREMCVWKDIRSIKEFLCVTVPDEIDYPLARFSNLSEIVAEVLEGGKNLGAVGVMDMPGICSAILLGLIGLRKDLSLPRMVLKVLPRIFENYVKMGFKKEVGVNEKTFLRYHR